MKYKMFLKFLNLKLGLWFWYVILIGFSIFDSWKSILYFFGFLYNEYVCVGFKVYIFYRIFNFVCLYVEVVRFWDFICFFLCVCFGYEEKDKSRVYI